MNIPGVKELAEEVRQGQRDLLVVLVALGDLMAATRSVGSNATSGWKEAVEDVRGRVGT